MQLSPFAAPGRPGGFILAATVDQADRFGDLNGYALVDDGQWREITMDVRRLREVYPELHYLQQFMFSTPWNAPPPAEPELTLEDCEFWFDDFAILPDEGE